MPQPTGRSASVPVRRPEQVTLLHVECRGILSRERRRRHTRDMSRIGFSGGRTRHRVSRPDGEPGRCLGTTQCAGRRYPAPLSRLAAGVRLTCERDQASLHRARASPAGLALAAGSTVRATMRPGAPASAHRGLRLVGQGEVGRGVTGSEGLATLADGPTVPSGSLFPLKAVGAQRQLHRQRRVGGHVIHLPAEVADAVGDAVRDGDVAACSSWPRALPVRVQEGLPESPGMPGGDGVDAVGPAAAVVAAG